MVQPWDMGDVPETESGAYVHFHCSESPPLKSVIYSDKVKISSTSKTCDMSDQPLSLGNCRNLDPELRVQDLNLYPLLPLYKEFENLIETADSPPAM